MKPRAAGVRLKLHKRMPLASGLGSSGASAVAAAMAVNEVLGRPFTKRELLPSALQGERAACGSGHADNVAPSLLGGIVLVRSYSPLEVISLPVPAELRVVAVHPHVEVRTAHARELLAACRFPIGAVVGNLGNIGSLVAALYRNDIRLLGRAVEDALAEPVRAPLIPGFGAVKAAATEAGALACSISGSGPSLFAFVDSDAAAGRVADAMRMAFERSAGLQSDAWIGGVNLTGASVITGALG